MHMKNWYYSIFSIFSLFFIINGDTFSRKLTTQYNPNCPPDLEENRHVAYTRAVSSINPEDVMHFVVSVGPDLGPLSLLVIRSSGKDSRLNFNWTEMVARKKGGISMEDGKIVFKAAYIVARVWEFNDTKDKGNMSAVPPMDKNQSVWHAWDTDRFVWTVGDKKKIETSHVIEFTSNQTLGADGQPEMLVPAEEEEEDYGNGTTPVPPTSSPTPPVSPFKGGSKLQFRLVHSGMDDRADVQPRLQFTGNSTQLDVVMDHLQTHFPGSRFAITVVQMVSLSSSVGTMDVHMTESVDDEFTPGIFKMFNWKAVPKKVTASNQHDRSFLQWKPVCYTSPDRHLKMSQQMFCYPLPSKIDHADFLSMEKSVVFPLFGGHTTPTYNAIPMNISFGQSGDGFYKTYGYTSWTGSMGLGKPPADTISVLVIMIITIGLGLPVVLMICGSIYICIRRRRAPTISYEQIN